MVLTSKGRKTRTELLDEFHQPPAEFEVLERADLEALERVLTKMTASSAGRESRMGGRAGRLKHLNHSQVR